MNTKSFFLIFNILLSVSFFASADEIAVYGGEHGWQNTVSTGLSRTGGWKGYSALTLTPIGRNPFSENPDSSKNIDILLLAENNKLTDPAEHYRLEGNWKIYSDALSGGKYYIKPLPPGILLYPNNLAMWHPGKEWNDFTIEFRLNPLSLRDGETFFRWQGKTSSGDFQSITARIEKRRLIWNFNGFFRKGQSRSLNFQLVSPPLIPGEWRHHRIRYKRIESASDYSGSSPGLLEYLVDGVPSDIVHTTPDGRESEDIFYPVIGKASSGPLIIAPSFSGYIDEFKITSGYISEPPANGYSNRERSVRGKGKTLPLDTGYPDSEITRIKARINIPGNSRVRFFIKKQNSCTSENNNWPEPGYNGWIEINMKKEKEDPAGSSRWYTWDKNIPVSGRCFTLGYILEPDPVLDVSPVLSKIEISYKPNYPPYPPEGLGWQKKNGRIYVSWNRGDNDKIAGWWLFWSYRSGYYPVPGNSGKNYGSLWIPSDNTENSIRISAALPELSKENIVYVCVKSAWEKGSPAAGSDEPADFKALSDFSGEISIRP